MHILRQNQQNENHNILLDKLSLLSGNLLCCVALMAKPHICTLGREVAFAHGDGGRGITNYYKLKEYLCITVSVTQESRSDFIGFSAQGLRRLQLSC